MAQAAIQDWLKSEARSEAWGSVLFALGCGLMGGIALALTSAVLLSLAWVLVATVAQAARGTSVPAPGVSVGWVVALAVLGLMALFYVNVRVGRADGEAARRREERWFAGDGLGGGERVLRVLLAKGKRLALAELVIHAELNDPAGILMAFRELPGMIFLSQPPPGLTLSGEYRGELGAIAGPLPVLRDLGRETERSAAMVQSLYSRLGLTFPTEPPSGESKEASAARMKPVRTLRLPGQPWEAQVRETEDPADAAEGANRGCPPDPRRIWERHRRSGGTR